MLRVLYEVYVRAEGSCPGSHAGLFEGLTQDHQQQLLWLLFVCAGVARHRIPDLHTAGATLVCLIGPL